MGASERGAVAALFDFDGTLTRRDTFLPFTAHLARSAALGRLELARLGLTLLGYRLGRLSIEQLKTALLQRLAPLPAARREELIQGFCQRVLGRLWRPAGLERLAWHRRRGHRLVLVSASLEIVLRPAVAGLGLADVIGTAHAEQPRWRVAGANCYGPEKIRRLASRPWFQRVDWAASWAYSDHPSDVPLLTLCGHPVAANPTPALRRHAERAGWRIMDWR